jgi:uncharacterized membrane protein YbhN (UPF0104 family)
LAALERWLLRAASSRLGLGVVTAVVTGANAMTGVLPGGGVLSLGWTVRQLQRRCVAFATAAAGAVSVTLLVLLLTLGAVDAACLVACLWALGFSAPWRGFPLAYTLTQLFGSLRITLGSLGVTEVSLTALHVLYGQPAGQAIAATLLYRGLSFWLSFWLLQPIGRSCWLAVTLHTPKPRTG